jgi:hypothetical protein
MRQETLDKIDDLRAQIRELASYGPFELVENYVEAEKPLILEEIETVRLEFTERNILDVLLPASAELIKATIIETFRTELELTIQKLRDLEDNEAEENHV